MLAWRSRAMSRFLRLVLLTALAGIAGSVFFVPYYHLMPEPYSYRTPLSENALVFGAFYLFCFVPLLLLACGIAQTVGRRRGSPLCSSLETVLTSWEIFSTLFAMPLLIMRYSIPHLLKGKPRLLEPSAPAPIHLFPFPISFLQCRERP